MIQNFATLEGFIQGEKQFCTCYSIISDPGNKTLLWQKMALPLLGCGWIPKKSRIPEPNKKYAYEMGERSPLIG